MATALKSKGVVSTMNSINQVPMALVSKAKSAQLIKDVSAIIISTVLFNRKVVPNDCFEQKYLGKEVVQVLKANASDPIARCIAERIIAIHDAINKGYLHELKICIKDADTLIETHTLVFEHSGDYYDKFMVLHCSKLTKPKKREFAIEYIAKEIDQMYQNIKSVTEKVELPSENLSCWLHVKFFDKVTPNDYQIENFQPANKKFKNLQSQSVYSGAFGTPFHSLKLRSKLTAEGLDQLMSPSGSDIYDKMTMVLGSTSSRQDQVSITGPAVHPLQTNLTKTTSDNRVMETTEVQCITLDESNYVESEFPLDHTEPDNQPEPPLQSKSIENIDQIMNLANDEIENMDITDKIQCPCGLQFVFGTMLKCDKCGTFQHMNCFDIIEEEHAPDVHICTQCATDKESCTVPELLTLPDSQLKDRCIFRLALSLCQDPNIIMSPEVLCDVFKLNEEYAVNLLERLYNLKLFITKQGGFIVNKRVFKRIIVPNYFTNFVKGSKATLRRERSPYTNLEDKDNSKQKKLKM